MKKDNFQKGEILIYKTPQNEVELKVKLEKETIWLNQSQIALLFDTKRPAITKHLNNIFKTGELKKIQLVPFWNILPLTAKSIKHNFIA